MMRQGFVHFLSCLNKQSKGLNSKGIILPVAKWAAKVLFALHLVSKRCESKLYINQL